jgi:uncharacterized protein (TIGR03435 family)
MAFATKDGHSRVKASKQPLAPLAKLLGNALGRPVLDYTGLTGNYDYYLDWVPEDLSSAAASDHDSFAGERESSPDLFSALQEQLGLKLQSAKGPVEVLVVDRADRSPTQN